MTKEKLTKLLKNIPDDAIVYIEAGHGQKPEQVSGMRVTGDRYLSYYGDDMNWVGMGELDPKDVMAILIW